MWPSHFLQELENNTNGSNNGIAIVLKLFALLWYWSERCVVVIECWLLILCLTVNCSWLFSLMFLCFPSLCWLMFWLYSWFGVPYCILNWSLILCWLIYLKFSLRFPFGPSCLGYSQLMNPQFRKETIKIDIKYLSRSMKQKTQNETTSTGRKWEENMQVNIYAINRWMNGSQLLLKWKISID